MPEGVAPLAELAASLGVLGVELWHPQNTTITGLDHAISRVRAAGLEVICLSSGIELYRCGGSVADQQRLLELVSAATQHGVRFVNTYFGYASIVDDSHAIDVYARLLEPCLAAAGDDVTILLENEFDSFGWDPAGTDVSRRPEALLRLFERVGSERFRLTFDPANFLCAGVRPLEACDALAHHVGYVHVKDVRSGKVVAPGWREYHDHGKVFATCPFGEGEVPWRALLGRLQSEGYAGIFNLEPHSQPEDRERAFRGCLTSLSSMLTDGAPVTSAAPS